MLVLADEPTVDARRQGAGRAYRGQVPGEPGPVRTVERHTCLALEASGQRETRKPHRPRNPGYTHPNSGTGPRQLECV